MFSRESYDTILFNLFNVGALILILVSSVTFLNNNQSFNIQNILIIGLNLTEEKSVSEELSYLKNQSILSMDKKQILDKLLAKQFISSVDISLLLPNTVILNIQEITPIGILSINDRDFLIDNKSNGSYCDSNVSNNIFIPKIEIDTLKSVNMIFNHPSYNLIKNIYDIDSELFHFINTISSNKDKIHINLKNNSYVVFDFSNHANQLKYLISFLENFDEINPLKFDYIKFVDSNLIVKGMI